MVNAGQFFDVEDKPFVGKKAYRIGQQIIAVETSLAHAKPVEVGRIKLLEGTDQPACRSLAARSLPK